MSHNLNPTDSPSVKLRNQELHSFCTVPHSATCKEGCNQPSDKVAIISNKLIFEFTMCQY